MGDFELVIFPVFKTIFKNLDYYNRQFSQKVYFAFLKCNDECSQELKRYSCIRVYKHIRKVKNLHLQLVVSFYKLLIPIEKNINFEAHFREANKAVEDANNSKQTQ